MKRTVEVVASRFRGVGRVRQCEHLRGGHIHDTWSVTAAGDAGADESDIVLQRLNEHVFPNCVRMMGNMLRVVTHLRERLREAGVADPERRSVSVLRTDDESVLASDDQGRLWRAFARVPGAASHDLVTSPEQARQVGRGLGRFVVEIQDLAGPPLEEPIPGFKDFERRQQAFEALVDNDPYARAETCDDEIKAVRTYHRLGEVLAEARASGGLPTRIVHNDAKAGNVLLDDATGEALCVIDLDTVAPGTVLFDLGDLLRSATVTSPEDATDLAALAVRDDLLEAALHGYLAEAASLLTCGEREMIPLAGPLMAYESALRFLTDHLAGDTYFHIDRPRHNLDRARAQLRVLEALDQAGARVAELVARA